MRESSGDGTGSTATAVTRVDVQVTVLDERVAARATARGLDALVYAPPFTRLATVERRAARFDGGDLTVIPGREVVVGPPGARRRLLAVGLASPVPDFLTLNGAVSELDRQGAAILAISPGAAGGLSRAEIDAHAPEIDAVQTYNASLSPRRNRAAGRIAAASGHPGFGASGARRRGTVGEAWTAFDRPIAGTADLVAAFREGAPRRTMRRRGLAHRARAAAEYGHRLYDRTWRRLERAYLSAMVPTHPDSVAYGGRFDEYKAL